MECALQSLGACQRSREFGSGEWVSLQGTRNTGAPGDRSTEVKGTYAQSSCLGDLSAYSACWRAQTPALPHAAAGSAIAPKLPAVCVAAIGAPWLPLPRSSVAQPDTSSCSLPTRTVVQAPHSFNQNTHKTRLQNCRVISRPWPAYTEAGQLLNCTPVSFQLRAVVCDNLCAGCHRSSAQVSGLRPTEMHVGVQKPNCELCWCLSHCLMCT